jgi:hypothetical protein
LLGHFTFNRYFVNDDTVAKRWTTTTKIFSQASWDKLDMKRSRNKSKPKQEQDVKKRVN